MKFYKIESIFLMYGIMLILIAISIICKILSGEWRI